ncbi:MAG TPA: efflux RND transporter periplasmic adaptor subunit [Gemmatimonadales bacterium]
MSGERTIGANMSKRGKVLVGAGVAVVIAGLVVISAGARRDRGAEVRFEKVGHRDLVAAVTASGKIQPKKKVDISADITGRITRIAVREGDLVTRGQFLLQIDPTIYQANLQQAEATLASSQAAAVQAKANRDQAERALRRTKELRDQNPNLISPEQLEQAQTAFEVADANLTAAQHQVDQARAAVQSARDNLRKTTLVAPMSGRVTRLPVEEGEVAVPSTFSKDIGLLMTISDLSVIQAKVKVDETDVVRLHLGDSVEVSIDAFPDTTFLGRVTKVSNSSVRDAATSATGQNDRAVDYDVEVTLDKPPTDIRPDLSATARIVTDTRREALSIPIIALTVREHKPVSTEARPVDTSTARKKKETEGVFVVEKGVATFRPVKVGIAGDEYFEVLDGLKEGETIVAGPYQAIRDLKDGARVRAMKQAADTTKKKRAA